jgi:hypothetical protein
LISQSRGLGDVYKRQPRMEMPKSKQLRISRFLFVLPAVGL